MDRSETAGLGVAVLAHAGLLALLSLTLLTRQAPPKSVTAPIEVSFAPDVSLQASAPTQALPPAPSQAPDQGPPEDAAPPPAPEPAPEPKPAPRAVQPKAAPPEPVPKPRPAPVTARPEPAPEPKEPAPKPKPVKSTPKAERTGTPKPTKSAAASSKHQPLAPPSVSAGDDMPRVATGKPARVAGTGTDTASAKSRPRGARLGDDILKGLSDAPAKPRADAPAASAVKVDARALAGLQGAIERQIRPCASTQVAAGMPAEARAIVIRFGIQLSPDGSLAAAPRIIDKLNVDDDNARYAQQVADVGIAAFKRCSPLHLPPELYATPAGGWNNFVYRWKLS